MEIKLIYPDSQTQQLREIIADTPIAIGCNISCMPKQVDSQAVFQIVIFQPTIKPYHALITANNGRLKVRDDRDRAIKIEVDSLTLGTVSLSLLGDFSPTWETASNEENLGESNFNESNRCQKMVGFLFKRICDRTTSVDCPHCKQVEQDFDVYAIDYGYYENYGSYDTWGHTYYRDRHHYHYDYYNRRVEFTEADNVAFETEGDRDFEQNFSAS